MQLVSPSCQSSVSEGLQRLGNPKATLKRIHALIGQICSQLAELSSQELDSDDVTGSPTVCLERVSSIDSALGSNADKSTVKGLYLSGSVHLSHWLYRPPVRMVHTNTPSIAT